MSQISDTIFHGIETGRSYSDSAQQSRENIFISFNIVYCDNNNKCYSIMKIVYNIIKSLRPYFFSLREIKDDVSLDLKIPVNWEFEELMEAEVKIKVQDAKETTTLISLISPSTVEGYDVVFKYAKAIITFNKEKEEKSRLFSQRVEELKTLFLSSPLEKLKDITFDKFLEKDELRDKPGAREIKLGDEEGPGTDGKK